MRKIHDGLAKSEEIDDVDSKLLEYFEYRMDLAHKVAQYKKKNGLPVFDSAREKEKLDSLKKLIKDKDNTDAVVELFSQIMAISRRAQYRQLNTFFDLGFIAVNEFRAGSDTNIAYYGEPGSYTQQAMLEYFNGKGIGRPINFYEVMERGKQGRLRCCH